MAYLDWEDVGQYSALIYINGLNTDRAYQSVIMKCNGSTSPNMRRTYASSRSDAWRINGLECGTKYTVTWTLISGSGTPGGSSATFTTADCPVVIPYPDDIGTVSLSTSSTEKGKISAWWAAVNNVTNYRAEIRRYGSSTLVDSFSTGTTNEANFYDLLESTHYEVKIYGQNTRGNGGASTNNIWTAKMKDTTPPVITGLKIDGEGHIYVSFSATDDDSGMRSSSTYYTEISNADGSTFGKGEYSTNAWRTFTTDNSGNSLVHGKTYTVRVTAYDNEANWAQRTISGIYKMSRPDDWSAHTTKNAGSNVNIAATEWNSFCTRISEFSLYKTGSAYTFTNVVKGNQITAAQCNLIRTKIAGMGAAVPTAATPGSNLLASYFNGLVTSLNSIK